MVVKVVAAGVAVVFVLWTPSNSWLGIHHRLVVVSVVVECLLWLLHKLVVSVVVVRPSSNSWPAPYRTENQASTTGWLF